LLRLPPPSPLFPYTTLFRSWDSCCSSPSPPAGRFGNVMAPPADARLQLETARLTALYGRRAVVKDVSLMFPRHTVTALIGPSGRSEEHTSELQSRFDLVCRL